ncbi:MAG: threonine/serine exporter family protein [Peptoniphilaceae bacterium]|nr:threonine/serine exporter family protein [Peptoniphilaceae bacterium]MDD7383027.1 threonine/serine exporter family protein [Peptoniphilaceae bacterium]MDY3737778.1 threonine/serine exporter family protein [Peptoniphilaceae bacterium]
MEEKNQHKIYNSKDAMNLLEIASLAGSLMIKNGAEIYRVEDTAERILKSVKEVGEVDVFATNNVIIISFNVNDEIFTNVKSVKARSNNLNAINYINSFSRNFVEGKYSFKQSLDILHKKEKIESIYDFKKIFGTLLVSFFYTAMFKGSIIDCFVSLIVALLVSIIMRAIEKKKLGYFLENFISGILDSIFAISFLIIFKNLDINIVIIGTMMPYLPGLLIANSVRDMMSGDLNSGLIGSSTAILTSAALAFGVSIPLSIYLRLM